MLVHVTRATRFGMFVAPPGLTASMGVALPTARIGSMDRNAAILIGIFMYPGALDQAGRLQVFRPGARPMR